MTFFICEIPIDLFHVREIINTLSIESKQNKTNNWSTTMTTQLKTPEQARQWFDDNGISITEWCRDNKLSRMAVVEIIYGRRKGLRGEGHKAAVALGIKADPNQEIAA
jgi:gp16 family phage-associated protein